MKTRVWIMVIMMLAATVMMPVVMVPVQAFAESEGADTSSQAASEKGTELTALQKMNIVNKCEAIKEDLVNLQHNDSRARVYLGRYYEIILTKFITPLNVRLVSNNMSNAKLVENQNSFAASRKIFMDDFVTYQKELEGVVAMDCKNQPEDFYEKLTRVRKERAKVAADVVKMRELSGAQLTLVKDLEAQL